MITFTFYTMAERKPKHNEDILYLHKTSSFGMDGFRPRESVCCYEWVDADSTSYGYSEDDLPEDTKDMTLQITVDGYVMDEDIVWCTVDEFYDAADTMFGE